MKLLAPGLVAALAILHGCPAQPPPPTSHGVKTPLARGGGSPVPGVTAPPVEPFTLDDFVPLLALPELERARAAVEAERPAAAARLVKAAMAETPPPPEDVKRWQFLLARLLERAGDLAGAAASYELAAREPWVLEGYARLGAGRALVRAGLHRRALRELARVPDDLAVRDEVAMLTAEAARGSGRRDLAIEKWRALLAQPDPPRQRLRVALSLAQALLDGAKPHGGEVAEVLEALRHARSVRIEASGTMSARARAVERRALSALPASRRSELSKLTTAEELLKVRVLLDRKQDDGAEEAADALLGRLPDSERWGPIGCEAVLLRSKAIAMKREQGRAADSLSDAVVHCRNHPDLRARLLFLAGKYAARDGRHAQAVRRYRALEKELPGHRLADDARMKAALSFYELGAEGRFTELLATMPEDYPDGDVVLDGVFRLALRRVEKKDWSGAASVLDRAAVLVGPSDGARGTELSGRERYFRARAWIELGQTERGLDEYEAIVRELPLSYYMLHAYSRLLRRDPARARRVREQAIAAASEQPFHFEHRPEFERPGFRRALELLRQGDVARGKAEIQALGIRKRGTAPGLLWGVALLYARAGSAKLSHGVARGLLTDWLGRWPAGDWSKAWEIAFPRPYHVTVEREAKKNGVPESLVYAIMREESAFDPDAVSPASAHGLMQLIVPTAKLYARPVGLPYDSRSLKRPSVNIAVACRALAALRERYRKNPVLLVPAYNAGPGRPTRWLRDRPQVDFDVWVELIPFGETRRYTKRVLASRAAYAVLYDPAHADEALELPARLQL